VSNIIFDIDEVLFKGTVIPAVATLYSLDLPIDFYLNDWPVEARETALSLFKNQGIMCHLLPNYGASLLVNQLKKAGHTVHAVTARPHSQQEETQAMVDRHFDGVQVFCAHGYDKKEMYKKLNADLVIDDNTDHIEQAIDVGAIGVLYSNDETPWNWGYDGKKIKSFISKHQLIEGWLKDGV